MGVIKICLTEQDQELEDKMSLDQSFEISEQDKALAANLGLNSSFEENNNSLGKKDQALADKLGLNSSFEGKNNSFADQEQSLEDKSGLNSSIDEGNNSFVNNRTNDEQANDDDDQANSENQTEQEFDDFGQLVGVKKVNVKEKRKLKEKDKSHSNEEPSWRMKLLLTPEQDKQSNEENDEVKSAAKPKKERDFLDGLLAVKKNTPKEKINLKEKGKKVINDETNDEQANDDDDQANSENQ